MRIVNRRTVLKAAANPRDRALLYQVARGIADRNGKPGRR